MIALVPSLGCPVVVLPTVYAVIDCSFLNQIAFKDNQAIQAAFELWIYLYFPGRCFPIANPDFLRLTDWEANKCISEALLAIRKINYYVSQ